MLNFQELLANEETLDPATPNDWDSMRRLGHEMVETMFDLLQNIRSEPVWTKPTDTMKQFLQTPLPVEPQNPYAVFNDFCDHILPFPKGNIHPRFWGWVQGTGTPLGMLADMLASGMNPNNTIGDHSAMYVEQQVLSWCKEMMGFPAEASGILVSGGSMANITAIIVARNAFGEKLARQQGLKALSGQLLMYTSVEAHMCIQKAAEICGLGADAVRKVPVNADYRINLDALKQMLTDDRAAGHLPFCIVANVGTVNTGAIDPLDELLAIARAEGIWLHADGAFGALAKLVPEYSEQLRALEDVDSVAFDLHKWMSMNYEVGCLLIRNAEAHRSAFAVMPNYLLAHERGLAAGPESITNYGMELSRGFKALKVWMSLKEHGIEKYRRIIRQNIAQALYLEDLILTTPELELLAPVPMNIVCYRFCSDHLNLEAVNTLNKEILMRLHEEGIATPSYTLLEGRYAIRMANVNHRSVKEDFDVLVRETVRIGKEILAVASTKGATVMPMV